MTQPVKWIFRIALDTGWSGGEGGVAASPIKNLSKPYYCRLNTGEISEYGEIYECPALPIEGR